MAKRARAARRDHATPHRWHRWLLRERAEGVHRRPLSRRADSEFCTFRRNGPAIPLAAAIEPVTAGRINILVLGGDAGPGRWDLRPDRISVASIDLDTASTTIIGIPRNLQRAPVSGDSPLRGPYPDGYNCGAQCRISFLYAYASLRPQLYPGSPQPGVEATCDAVEGVLGIDIQYAVLMDMGGLETSSTLAVSTWTVPRR